MPHIRFFATSLPNPGGHPPFCEGIRAEIVIDAKSSLHCEFPAMAPGESPRQVLARAPHELRLNWGDKLLAWLNGQEGVSGTPLEAVAAISRAQTENLKACGLHSVEDLAQCPSPVLEHLGATGERLREIARTFLADAGGKEGDLAAMRRENADLRTQMEAMQANMTELVAALHEQPQAEPDKKPRTK